MDLTFVLFIAIILVFLIIAVAYYLSNQMKSLKSDINNEENQVLMKWLKDEVQRSSDVVERNLQDQRKTLEEQLKGQREAMNAQTKLVWERLDEAQKVIGSMHQQIGGIQEFGKDIKDLSNVLKSPKLRGGLGEQLLYEILDNYIPKDLYRTQYKFKDGSTCDAVIFMEDEIVSIDSKFPMDNFKVMVTAENPDDREKYKKAFIKDVKLRIDEISTKYILPEEGTSEQAIMYVPSENVYYEIAVNNTQIAEYARKKNVFMASPNTLASFLKSLLTFYQRRELQKHASEILKALEGIKVEAEKFDTDLGILERHVSNAYKSMDNVRNKFGRLFNKIDNVQSLSSGDDKKLIE